LKHQKAHKTQKAGRGSKAKFNVVGMTESTALENIEKGRVKVLLMRILQLTLSCV
jgi:hypothetical protein